MLILARARDGASIDVCMSMAAYAGSKRGSVKGSKGRISSGGSIKDAPNESEERERITLRDAPNERVRPQCAAGAELQGGGYAEVGGVRVGSREGRTA